MRIRSQLISFEDFAKPDGGLWRIDRRVTIAPSEVPIVNDRLEKVGTAVIMRPDFGDNAATGLTLHGELAGTAAGLAAIQLIRSGAANVAILWADCTPRSRDNGICKIFETLHFAAIKLTTGKGHLSATKPKII